MYQLEIAVTSLADALYAVQGGADSVEISRDLANGGLTPPVDLVSAILSQVTIPVHVIVRPHARSFVHTADEIETVLNDARQFAHMGAASIVFGAHREDGYLDTRLVQTVAEAVAPVPVTLHRALDGCANPESALKALIGIVPRVLTSGPAPNAWDGRDATRRWVERYGQHFRFVLSGSIRLDQLADLADISRADVYHIGSAARSGDTVEVDKVRRLRSALG